MEAIIRRKIRIIHDKTIHLMMKLIYKLAGIFENV
jgi:hypothetical protein